MMSVDPSRPLVSSLTKPPATVEMPSPSSMRFEPKCSILPKSSSSKEPGPLSAPSLVIAQYGVNDMKQIAKEALRLSKEALLWHRNHPVELQSGIKSLLKPIMIPNLAPNPNTRTTDPLAMVLPSKIKTTVATGSTHHSTGTSCHSSPSTGSSGSGRLNKFVRRLYDMLEAESESGIVEWRRGLLILQNTNVFAMQILPKYFNTRNFKTFRRQLNYYGFVHVRSFNTVGSTGAGSCSPTATTTTTASSTAALWVNRELVERCTASADDMVSDSIASVLLLKRVEPCEASKTVEGRRVRKELARSTVEEDLGVSSVRSMLWMPAVHTVADPSVSIIPTSAHPPKAVLQYHNHNACTKSSLCVEGTISCTRPMETNSLPDNEILSDQSLSSDDETTTQQDVHSSRSVANLLLLLSKA